MKSAAILLFVCFAIACGDAARPVSQNASNVAPSRTTEKPQTAVAHSSENQTPNLSPATGEKSKWTQSGDPFDTTEFDSAIASAEKVLAGKPNDTVAKKALAAAYLKRATALTEKRQYASALGDYRRTLKYEPGNAEAKEWIERIISIYASINRDSPAEGEEPSPLPFSKGK